MNERFPEKKTRRKSSASLEKLELLLRELAEDKNPKLVEGKRDKQALETLGIKNIYKIHNSPLSTLADRISAQTNEAIILTDFDRRGKQLLERLSELLEGSGVKVNKDYRRMLRLMTGIKYIEELDRRYEKIKNECRGGNNSGAGGKMT
ncbi:MAG: toprim domain-containing protein [Candidatus Micrarchaeota archaeon]